MLQNAEVRETESAGAVEVADRLQAHHRLLTVSDTAALCRAIESVDVSLMFAEMAPADRVDVAQLRAVRVLLDDRLVEASTREARGLPVFRSFAYLVLR